MNLIKNIFAFIIFSLMVGLTQQALAQVDEEISQEVSDELMNKSNIKGPLEFKGYVKELSKKLKGAIITLYESPDGSHEGLTEIFKTTSPGGGQFEFKLEINKFYVLSVEKSGYTTKKVDFDTDVTLAREQYTSVPKFEFEVDMVKDLDGLGFTGSVANVFYQIKTNKFDYELDYSKEEMEDEERELRERKEKERLAQLAYEKKKEIEEAARLLLDKENATAQQIIEAAITVGDGNKDKTVSGFLDVFPEVDSLREKKALVMYDELLEERKRTKATNSKINFQAIFDAAKAFENEIVAKEEGERQAKVEELRKEREEAERKAKEAMAIQQKAIEVEASEQLAKAIAEEELRKAKEEKEKRDKVYYAIFDAGSDSQAAIENLKKTFPKGDPYSEEKAKAIYAEYEKTRLSGTTLSNMDFSKLFAAADAAEQEAIRKEVAESNAEQNSRLDEFMAKVEERKREEQERTIGKIEEGLVDASKDRASQLAVFQDALPKNDPYKEAKAEAMYEQYKLQKEAANTIERTIGLVPKDKKTQYELFFNSLPEETENRQEVAQAMYDNYVASVVFNQAANAAEQQAEEKLIAESLPANTPGKEQIAKAIFKAAQNAPGQKPNKDKQIRAIMNSLPSGMANKQQVAEQVFDNYVAKKQAQGGTGTVSLDFASLFGAADAAAEVAREEEKAKNAIEKRKAQDQLEAQREKVREQKREIAQQVIEDTKNIRIEELAKAKSKKERDLATAFEKGEGDRDKTIAAIKKVLPETGDKELDTDRASAVYDAYLTESEAIRKSGSIGQKIDYATLFQAADNAELAKLERQFQQKEAERAEELAKYEEERTEKLIDVAEAEQKRAEKEAEQAAIAYEETLHRVEASRQERLDEQKKAEEELARSIAMEKAKREAIENELAESGLAAVEKERIERLKREREEQERQELALAEKQRKEEEAKRKEEERLALAQQKEEAARLKEEQKRLETERKAKEAEELAQAKAADEARKAEEKRLEEERKAKEAEELAQAKAAEEARKAEEKRLEEERKAKEAEELAQAKAAEEARIAEEKRLEEERKAAEAAALAAAKKAEEDRLAEIKRQEELAKQQAEEAERARRAQYDALVSEGDAAIAENDVRSAWSKYKDALAMYPEVKALERKLADTDAKIQELEEAEAAQLALDQKYDKLMLEGEQELSQNNYDAAIKKYEEASKLKPTEREPGQKIRNINRTLEQLAAEKKAKEDAERRYILLLQDGSKALAANNLNLAKEKYEEARVLKPDDQTPVDKLKEIEEREEQIAAAEAEKLRREEEAKRKYQEQLAAEEARKQAERDARLAALGDVDNATTDENATEAEKEQARIAKFESLKESLENIDLSEEERRQAFLSELARIYPEGLTKETVTGKNFVLLRHVINENNVVTIYERKTWDWGGVFYFKNTDIAITEALYRLEIDKYQ